jgi:TonB family protein
MRLQIAWALAHFLWQGAAIAVVLWILLPVLRDANTRYNACAVALALMCASPVATLFWLAPHTLTLRATGGRILDTALPASSTSTVGWFEANAAWLFWLWMTGTLVLLARAAVAWWRARGIVTRDFEPVPGSVEQAARRLAVQLGAKRVQFRASARVASALVFGWLKPIVVLPAAALGRLTEAEIEALLAHELAHVIRGDFFVNLLQTSAECVLFYHPLVWWVSARMREERELCCDDIAVAVCRDEVLYSRALLRLEELRMEPALAATGGRLAHRIRRLLVGCESERMPVAPGLALLLVLGVSVALLAQTVPPEPTAPPAAPAAPAAPPVPLPPARDAGSTVAYHLGADVSMPRPINSIEPEYTEEARAAKLEGSVLLSTIISAEGSATNLKVVTSLDKGLDQKAIEAARKYRFEPGRKGGKPVPVIANIEIVFRLFNKPPMPPVETVPAEPAVAPAPAAAPLARSNPLPLVAPVPRTLAEPGGPAVALEALEPQDPPVQPDALPAPPAPPKASAIHGGTHSDSSDPAELERRRGYAKQHFGGENTDRGKVYMHYGPPDEIESRPSQGKGMEIWRYKNASKTKVMLEIEFQDGKQVRRSGGLAADL